jgi:hypothetical protein
MEQVMEGYQWLYRHRHELWDASAPAARSLLPELVVKWLTLACIAAALAGVHLLYDAL